MAKSVQAKDKDGNVYYKNKVILWEDNNGVLINNTGRTNVVINNMPNLSNYNDGRWNLQLYIAYGGDVKEIKNFWLHPTNGTNLFIDYFRDLSGGNDFLVFIFLLSGFLSTTWTFSPKAQKSIDGNNNIANTIFANVRLYKVVVEKI